MNYLNSPLGDNDYEGDVLLGVRTFLFCTAFVIAAFVSACVGIA